MYQDIDEPWLQRERSVQPRLYIGLSLLQWMLREEPNRKLNILDVGAGLGGPTQYLRPFGKITATDISATAVKKASELVPDVEWVADDIRVFREEWTEAFDLIWMSEVLVMVLTEIDDALSNVVRYMKPNGRMIFNYYMPDNAWTSRYLADSKALYDKLVEYFKIEAFVDLNPYDGSQRELLGLLAKKSPSEGTTT